ncbi:MAG: ABC transporter ATP-binding protein [Pirellulales bacterium]|nr:ABC transporter ATP-binding protein [Pirellulales bacterium]
MNSDRHVVKMQQSGKLYVCDKDAGLIGLYGLRKDRGCMAGIQGTADPTGEGREVLLHLDNVSRTFRMGEVDVTALANATLDIYRGELLVVVGTSGSGKTTMLNLIGGLDSPSVGRVTFKNQDLTTATQRELTRFRRESVGFVFQFYNLVPNLTARENVMVATEIAANPLPIQDALEMVDLGERVDHFPAQLSGGEQQRVAIARALAKRPELLLCDEPTGALDFATGKRVLRLLLDLCRQTKTTVMIITHNTAIAQIADRVVHLRSGEIIELYENAEPVAPEEIDW